MFCRLVSSRRHQRSADRVHPDFTRACRNDGCIHGGQAFVHDGQSSWNPFPDDVRDSRLSPPTFKRHPRNIPHPLLPTIAARLGIFTTNAPHINLPMPFGRLSRVGQRNMGCRPPEGKGHFWGLSNVRTIQKHWHCLLRFSLQNHSFKKQALSGGCHIKFFPS